MGIEADRVRQMASSYRLSQLVYACVSLEVPDILLEGPATADQVATAIGADIRLTLRLLRAAASEGVLDYVDNRYQLNEFSEELCSAPTGSKREFVLGWLTLRTGYQAFGYLDRAIQTGSSGVELMSGRRFHDYMRDNPDDAGRYRAAMEETVEEFREVAAAFDFGRFRTIVDVGGGQGTFLVAIRQVHPTVVGVLFDLPDVVADAPARLAAFPEGSGISIRAGDMFQDLPEGGDAYMFSTVLRCFSDEECLPVLQRCAHSMTPGGHVLAVEMVLPEGIPPSPLALADLQALVVYGGQDRTEREWTSLLTSAGFAPPEFHPVGDPFVIVDAALRPR